MIDIPKIEIKYSFRKERTFSSIERQKQRKGKFSIKDKNLTPGYADGELRKFNIIFKNSLLICSRKEADDKLHMYECQKQY